MEGLNDIQSGTQERQDQYPGIDTSIRTQLYHSLNQLGKVNESDPYPNVTTWSINLYQFCHDVFNKPYSPPKNPIPSATLSHHCSDGDIGASEISND